MYKARKAHPDLIGHDISNDPYEYTASENGNNTVNVKKRDPVSIIKNSYMIWTFC